MNRTLLAALVILLAAAPRAQAQIAGAAKTAAHPMPPAFAPVSAQWGGALSSYFQTLDGYRALSGRGAVSMLHSSNPASPAYRAAVAPLVAALEAAGITPEGLPAAAAPAIQDALTRHQTESQAYHEALIQATVHGEFDVAGAKELLSRWEELAAAYPTNQLGLDSGLSTAREKLAAAQAAGALEAGRVVARELAGQLKDAEDENAAISVAVRMRHAAKRFRDDEAGALMISAMSPRLKDADEDEAAALRGAIEETAYAAQSDAPRLAAAKALVKDADDTDDWDDAEATLGRAMRLVDNAGAEAKLGLAAFLRETAKDDLTGDWNKKLLLRADRLEDDVRWDDAKASADTALMHALSEQLREAEGDAVELAAKRIGKLWPSSSGRSQEMAASALTRKLVARLERDGEWDEAAAKELEELGNMSAWKGVAELAAEGFTAAVSATDDDDIQEQARDSALRVRGQGKSSVKAPPAPAPAAAVSAPAASAPAQDPAPAAGNSFSTFVAAALGALGVMTLLGLIFS